MNARSLHGIALYGVLNTVDVGEQPLRAARANCVFCTDEKRIRAENTVMDKGEIGVGFLYKIADWARIRF